MSILRLKTTKSVHNCQSYIFSLCNSLRPLDLFGDLESWSMWKVTILHFFVSILKYKTTKSVHKYESYIFSLLNGLCPLDPFCDLESKNVRKVTPFYISLWAFWNIKRPNRSINAKVTFQPLKQPPSLRSILWPRILKDEKGNPLLYIFVSILKYNTTKSVHKCQSYIFSL